MTLPSASPRLRLVVTVAVILVGLCAATTVADHPRVAFFFGILAAAAALSVLRALVNREH